MFLQSGGQVTLNAEYFTPVGQSYYIDGSGSKLQENTLDFVLGNSAAAYVTNSGTLSAQYLSVGTNGNGTLTVDGPGSLAIATNGFSNFGLSHSTGTVTFSNGAQVHCRRSGTGAEFVWRHFGQRDGENGRSPNTGPLSIAYSSGNQESPSATLTVTDANSTIALSAGSTLQLSGPAIVGNATLNVQDNGSLTVGAGGNTLMLCRRGS